MPTPPSGCSRLRKAVPDRSYPSTPGRHLLRAVPGAHAPSSPPRPSPKTPLETISTQRCRRSSQSRYFCAREWAGSPPLDASPSRGGRPISTLDRRAWVYYSSSALLFLDLGGEDVAPRIRPALALLPLASPTSLWWGPPGWAAPAQTDEARQLTLPEAIRLAWEQGPTLAA